MSQKDDVITAAENAVNAETEEAQGWRDVAARKWINDHLRNIAEQKKKNDQRFSLLVGCLNNPREKLAKFHNYFGITKQNAETMTDEELVQWLGEFLLRWTKGKNKGEEKMTDGGCVVNFEIGDEGTPHCHWALWRRSRFRYSQIRAKFIDLSWFSMMRGNAASVESYMEKDGKNAEKAHTLRVAPMWFGSRDFLDEMNGGAGQRVLQRVQEMLDDDKTPSEIYVALGVEATRYKSAIETAYLSKKASTVERWRDVNVVWHTGMSGSGKSYGRLGFEEKTPGDIYVVQGGLLGSGRSPWDGYEFQKVLWLDEFRANIPLAELLTLLDGYRLTLPARYANRDANWSEVHISTVMAPEVCYAAKNSARFANLTDEEIKAKKAESFEQLIRRISTVRYHFIDPEYSDLRDPRRYCYIDFSGGPSDVRKGKRGGYISVDQCKTAAKQFLRRRHPDLQAGFLDAFFDEDNAAALSVIQGGKDSAPVASSDDGEDEALDIFKLPSLI